MRDTILEDTEAGNGDTTSKFGMWLFLFTELFLFVVLFFVFLSYRASYPEGFHHASIRLNGVIATANTFILLTSSFAVAISIVAIRKGHKRVTIWALIVTIALGVLFLVMKGFEWMEKIEHGIYPTAKGLSGLGEGENLFYGLYYLMTGLHALHVIGGIVLLFVMLCFVGNGRVSRGSYGALENSALYWHLVDIIWIYLFSFFYLVS